MGPLSTTDSVLQACESSSAAHLLQARRAEARAREYFSAQKLKFLYHGKKVAGVEIDLIFVDDHCNIIFVEVKSLTRPERMAIRLSKRQTDRIFMAKSFFEATYRLSVEVRVAFVSATDDSVTDLVIG